MSLISSRRPSFGVALSAINWSASVWLEGNVTFLSTVGAGCLVHFFLIHYVVSTPLSCYVQNTFAQLRYEALCFKLIHVLMLNFYDARSGKNSVEEIRAIPESLLRKVFEKSAIFIKQKYIRFIRCAVEKN